LTSSSVPLAALSEADISIFCVCLSLACSLLFYSVCEWLGRVRKLINYYKVVFNPIVL
jgi:hypothetical protein